MSFIFPANTEVFYVKGTFISAEGHEMYTEIPAVFNEDGTCNIELTQETIDKVIYNHNLIEQRMSANNAG